LPPGAAAKGGVEEMKKSSGEGSRTAGASRRRGRGAPAGGRRRGRGAPAGGRSRREGCFQAGTSTTGGKDELPGRVTGAAGR
jgi:hypothetical protein